MPRFDREYYDWIADTLYTAVLSDILDSVGYRNQAMPHTIRPLYEGARLVGRAATMLAVETWEIPEEPYKLEMALLDSLQPGEVVVCACQGSRLSGIWGELLSTHARVREGRGAIIDGLSRDSRAIRAVKFPVFAAGLTPTDSKGRSDVIEIRAPIMVGDVLIQNGDLIVADDDGCVAIPKVVEEDVVTRAMQKVASENQVRDVLRQGASIQQVYKERGIL